MNKVNLDNFTVEYNGNTFDMNDLCMLAYYYERLCTTEFIFEDKDVTKEEAYKIACLVREEVNDTCDCELRILDYYFDEFLEEVRAETLEN